MHKITTSNWSVELELLSQRRAFPNSKKDERPSASSEMKGATHVTVTKKRRRRECEKVTPFFSLSMEKGWCRRHLTISAEFFTCSAKFQVSGYPHTV
ncbi:hypothetical protein CEXT_581081 [Caerostris extrusa]|uniref:Uncharacterized protein n=1 Tax=Caerostris extrusa TaxID=172846 RepID=A0AAV4QYF0_CAEEX|nr:hypothetical protein CEXT_581081 [Caerostris extrusa]